MFRNLERWKVKILWYLIGTTALYLILTFLMGKYKIFEPSTRADLFQINIMLFAITLVYYIYLRAKNIESAYFKK